MNQKQIKKFTYFIFDRYAAGHEPTEKQFDNAMIDFKRSEILKETADVNNSDKRRKPINIVTK